MTHTIVTSIKMARLILGNEICDETDQINAVADIHVKMSYGFDVTI
jgi:hypothetical protein